MVITQDRRKLNEAIDKDGDQNWIVFLLLGADGSTAQRIHDYLGDKGLESFRKYFLIKDSTVLEVSERTAWFGDIQEDCYAVLKRVTKEVVASGPVTELLRPDGSPDIMNIRQAFSRG